MSESAYRAAVDERRIQDIRTISRELPASCADFFRGIAMTTSTFTRLAYALDLRTFFHYLTTERVAFSDQTPVELSDADIGRISQSDLEAYVEYLSLYYHESPTADAAALKPVVNHELAIKRKLCSLRAYFDYMFRSKRVPANVTQLVSLPKIHEKPILRLTMDEMRTMLDMAQTGEHLTKGQAKYQRLTAARDYAMLSLFLGTGIRVSECVGLDIDDVDFEQNAFLVTRKGGNQAVLYFPQEVADALQTYMVQRREIEPLPGHEEALFLSLQRRRITQRAVQQLVKKYAAYAAPLKPRISPHKLRSTFGTNLYHATGDIYLVADVLGHTSVDTTRRHYADMTDGRRRSAAEHVHLPAPVAPQEESPEEKSPNTE